MNENWVLNGFFDAPKLTGLYEAAQRRVSCRSYAAAPTGEQWNALLAAAESLALPGVRIVPGLCDNALFQPMMGLFMKFENVQRYAAILATDDRPESTVNAGVSGELFMLRAVELGLAGCWVSGTFKRRQVSAGLRQNERLLAVLALGVPQADPQLPLTRKRKAPEAFCPDYATLPSALREVVDYVRIAPSAMNMQPWRFACDGQSLRLWVGAGAQRLDLGIALSHALLALGSTPATFALDEDATGATLTLL